MSEKPILFSAPMVRAILAGTKTQTRRAVKARKDRDMGCELAPSELAGEVNGGDYRNSAWIPGDRLWVREAWSTHTSEDHLPPRECDRTIRFYEADHGRQRGLNPRIGKLRPSMFMPRWHSRITLEITGVRVERLQDISEAGARAEGVLAWAEGACAVGNPYDLDPIGYFELLWSSINGRESWKANPWVWVVEFRRVEGAA